VNFIILELVHFPIMYIHLRVHTIAHSYTWQVKQIYYLVEVMVKDSSCLYQEIKCVSWMWARVSQQTTQAYQQSRSPPQPHQTDSERDHYAKQTKCYVNISDLITNICLLCINFIQSNASASWVGWAFLFVAKLCTICRMTSNVFRVTHTALVTLNSL